MALFNKPVGALICRVLVFYEVASSSSRRALTVIAGVEAAFSNSEQYLTGSGVGIGPTAKVFISESPLAQILLI